MNMVIAQVSSINENNVIQSVNISVPIDECPDSMPQINGYASKTTFWNDFSIADKGGLSSIQDTFDRAFSEWKDNYVYLTELVMVLNHKLWYWCDKNEKYYRLYNTIYEQADSYAYNNLKGEELDYFCRTTD